MRDARTSKRFPLELPVEVKEATAERSQEAVTSNMSAAGVYIRTQQHLEVGAPVEFDITLPAEAISAANDVKVHCSGHVVRVDHHGGDTGVACVIDNYEFVRSAEGKR